MFDVDVIVMILDLRWKKKLKERKKDRRIKRKKDRKIRKIER